MYDDSHLSWYALRWTGACPHDPRLYKNIMHCDYRLCVLFSDGKGAMLLRTNGHRSRPVSDHGDRPYPPTIAQIPASARLSTFPLFPVRPRWASVCATLHFLSPWTRKRYGVPKEYGMLVVTHSLPLPAARQCSYV